MTEKTKAPELSAKPKPKTLFFSKHATYSLDATTPEMRKEGKSLIVHFSNHHYAATADETQVMAKHPHHKRDFWVVPEHVKLPPSSKKITKEHVHAHDALVAHAHKMAGHK